MTWSGWESWRRVVRLVLTMLALAQGVTPDLNDIASPFLLRLVTRSTSQSFAARKPSASGIIHHARPGSPLDERGGNPCSDEDQDPTGDDSCTIKLASAGTASRLHARLSAFGPFHSTRVARPIANPTPFASRPALDPSARGGLIHLLCRMTC